MSTTSSQGRSASSCAMSASRGASDAPSSARTVPPSALARPAIRRSSVDLPVPERPRTACQRPPPKVSVRRSNTDLSPKASPMPATSTPGAPFTVVPVPCRWHRPATRRGSGAPARERVRLGARRRDRSPGADSARQARPRPADADVGWRALQGHNRSRVAPRVRTGAEGRRGHGAHAHPTVLDPYVGITRIRFVGIARDDFAAATSQPSTGNRSVGTPSRAIRLAQRKVKDRPRACRRAFVCSVSVLQVSTTILPPASSLSINRCAATISSSLNVLAILTFRVPASTWPSRVLRGVCRKSSDVPL